MTSVYPFRPRRRRLGLRAVTGARTVDRAHWVGRTSATGVAENPRQGVLMPLPIPTGEVAAGPAEHSELIVLVDEDGRPIGTAPKLASHHRDTPLHLAFSSY